MKNTRRTVLSEPKPETSSVRWTAEDWKIITALRAKTGIRSVAELLRKALRDCAEKEGLT